MKRITIIILAICMLPFFSCSAIIESQMEHLGESLEELGDNLDDMVDDLDDMEDDLDDMRDDIDDLNDDIDDLSDELEETGSYSKSTFYIESNNKLKSRIEISKNDKLKTRKFNITDFSGLNVGSSFVIVMCDTVDQVTIHINEKLDNYLSVKVKNSILNISLERIKGITTKDNAKCGYIYLPYNTKLCKFSLSGIASFATALPLNANSFVVDLSGASSFKGKVNCTNFSADLSGTARCRTDVKCKSLDADLSGASRLESNIDCSSANVDLSGTAKLKGNIKATSIQAGISGASKIELAGNCDKATVDITGTGKLDCKKLHLKRISGDMSGASSAIITCSDFIDMDLSGTSHLVYYGNPKTDIDASTATKVERK